MQAQLWTVNGLAVELGMDRRAVAKALEELEPDDEATDGAGRVTRKWRMARVFGHLSGAAEAGDLNPVQELARKNKALADKTEMEIAVRVGELGVISQVAAWYGDHIRKCKARLVQIPDAVGQFCDPRNAAIVVSEVRRLIHEGLAELAAGRPRLGQPDSGGMGAAADSGSEPMGGPEPETFERGERGAGAMAHQ